MMKTIAKNRVAAFLPKIANVTVYSLDNGFKGEPATIEWAVKLDAKFMWDGKSKGKARCHSNLWYEFEVAA